MSFIGSVTTDLPTRVTYVITIDQWIIPIVPENINFALRSEAGTSYQPSFGGFTQKVYTPTLEELSFDLRLPKFYFPDIPNIRYDLAAVNTGGIQTLVSNGTSYTDNWKQKIQQPGINGMMAVIDMLKRKLKVGEPVNINIARYQGPTDSPIGIKPNTGLRTSTTGKYLISALDIEEEASDSLFATVTVSATEYVRPQLRTIKVDVGNNLYLQGGNVGAAFQPIDEQSQAISTTSALFIAASPVQLSNIKNWNITESLMGIFKSSTLPALFNSFYVAPANSRADAPPMTPLGWENGMYSMVISEVSIENQLLKPGIPVPDELVI